MLVSPNNGCVDLHVLVVGIARQQPEKTLENPLFAHWLKRW